MPFKFSVDDTLYTQGNSLSKQPQWVIMVLCRYTYMHIISRSDTKHMHFSMNITLTSELLVVCKRVQALPLHGWGYRQ